MIEIYPVQLSNKIALIDGYDMGLEERTGIYVINEEQLTIIETGPSPSVAYIKEGLRQLGHRLEDVAFVIVTHIHLDHAGGAGVLLQNCPNAKLIVHPKGARHLIDPARLVAGAKTVYGDRFSTLFDPVVPVAEEKILVKGDGDQLRIGPSRILEFWDSPGHANHHMVIIDRDSNSVFTGDTAGIHYEPLAKEKIDFYLPSTSPNQFDPDLMRKSISRLQQENFSRVFYSHYGVSENPEAAFKQVLEWLDVFMGEAEMAVEAGESPAELAERLRRHVSNYLHLQGIQDDHKIYLQIDMDLLVGAMGLLDYLNKES